MEHNSTMTVEAVQMMIETKWIHDNTETQYEVLHVANIQAATERRDEYPVTVVYRNVETGEIWSKPISRFIAGMSRMVSDE